MKYVLITGAYGGMGYATAKLLAENGFTVFAVDKKIKDPEKNIIPLQTDITDTESIEKTLAEIKTKTNELYAIIHFAGVYRLDSLVEMTEKRFTEIFDINLFGAYRINKAFLPLMKKGGRIIVTTSELATLTPLPFTGVYAVTKSALDKYAFSLRMELQLLGVKVSVIRAGAVKTELLNDSTNELDNFCKNTKIYVYNAERFHRIVNAVETKNVSTAKIAKIAMRALISSRPKYVYYVNRNPMLKFFNILPPKLQTKIIGKILEKGKKRSKSKPTG